MSLVHYKLQVFATVYQMADCNKHKFTVLRSHNG